MQVKVPFAGLIALGATVFAMYCWSVGHFLVSSAQDDAFGARVRIVVLRKMLVQAWTHPGHNLDTGRIFCANQGKFESRAEVIA